ncbi:hypothetical protein DAPPUDRAFT_250847 [Daphnia pulex]|uniref:Uncharacterized protein n=1 Tax=Daphnia pulex TaxID=6669 RepID=E9GZD0_DAPPU|nr:hypothetical protein DAPPUDRAFT_250847 [Daphnia pulex]|eukprot:EFX75130.1 hypothetical protein DAPPUDRAFT_250847 [Daphnia pulex]
MSYGNSGNCLVQTLHITEEKIVSHKSLMFSDFQIIQTGFEMRALYMDISSRLLPKSTYLAERHIQTALEANSATG